MVKLIWDSKESNSNKIFERKNKYSKGFEKFETFPKNSNSFNEDDWKNSLYWGDNLEVSLNILDNFEGKINLIYIDPPFFSGANYHINISHEGNKFDSTAYFDKWNGDLDSYLQMLFERIQIFHKLLAKDGLIFIHLDYHAYHYVKIILDEIFGKSRFINEIIWYYYNKYSAGKNNLPRAHDNIMVYSKSNQYTFNEIRLPREKPHKQLKRVMVNGVLKNFKDENGHVVYRVVTDKKLDDVWKIPCLQPASKEWTGFPTQKHPKLIDRIIKIGSNKGDIIADFFCGSGTTLLTAEKLSRKWIGCDISPYSIYITKKRMINSRLSKENKQYKFYPIEFYSCLSEENLNLINSGFFEKELEIKRR
jgi:adenine specific DNA methylase Mod